MAYIYKVTNTNNGKVYIGQTKYSISWRWHTHLYATYTPKAVDHNSLLHRAIRKHGIDSFVVDELEECTSDKLNDREIAWIEKYDSTNKAKGYNISRGGGGCSLYSDDEIKKLWDGGYSASEIARLIPGPISRGTVRLRLLGMGVTHDEIRIRKNEAIARSHEKMVYQYDKGGNYIKAFYSATKAAREVRCNRTNVASCAQGLIKSAGGYIWSYEKRPKLDAVTKNQGFTLVGKYDPKNGRIIAAYVSLTAAGENNNISRKRLAIACEREEVYRGAKWKFLDTEGGIIRV